MLCARKIKSQNLVICISKDFLWWLNTYPLTLPMGVKVHFLRWHEFSIQTHISLFPPTSLSRRIIRSTRCLIQHYVKISCTIILFGGKKATAGVPADIHLLISEQQGRSLGNFHPHKRPPDWLDWNRLRCSDNRWTRKKKRNGKQSKQRGAQQQDIREWPLDNLILFIVTPFHVSQPDEWDFDNEWDFCKSIQCVG